MCSRLSASIPDYQSEIEDNFYRVKIPMVGGVGEATFEVRFVRVNGGCFATPTIAGIHYPLDKRVGYLGGNVEYVGSFNTSLFSVVDYLDGGVLVINELKIPSWPFGTENEKRVLEEVVPKYFSDYVVPYVHEMSSLAFIDEVYRKNKSDCIVHLPFQLHRASLSILLTQAKRPHQLSVEIEEWQSVAQNWKASDIGRFGSFIQAVQEGF